MTDDEAVWRFTILSDLHAELGESPAWSNQDNCVWWIDVSGKALLRTDCENGRTRRWNLPETVGFAVLADDGSVAIGLESGIYRFAERSGLGLRFAPSPGEGLRYNDASIDPAGRIVCGTMDRDNARPAGTISRIEPDGSVSVLFTGLYTPNGLAFDAVRNHMYFSDSHPESRTIWVCDYDPVSGKASDRRILDVCQDRKGRPDGGVVDNAGNYWIAGVDAGELWCYSPEGERIRTVATDSDFPTKMTFGGSRGDRVYLTSKHMDGEGGFLCQAIADVTGVGQKFKNNLDTD